MSHVAKFAIEFDKNDPKAVRAAIRAGTITGETSGLGSAYDWSCFSFPVLWST